MIQFLKRTAAGVTAATANRIKFFFDENGAPAFKDESGVLGNFISSASIDATPTNGSNNPVASNGAYDADEAVKAFAIQRSNHTGTQTASTISDFGTAAASAAPVSSVFGRTGAVTAQSGDYTKAQVGLSNVDNTSDANKPVSTATQTALNLKYDASNPNAYETPSQLNTRDTNNRARANHTGTQLSSTISDFASGVLTVVLTGLSTATNAAISATDSVLAAMGKLQAQISARLVSANNLSDLDSASTARTNLGLGTAATQNTTAFDAAGSAASAQAFSIQRANHTGTQLANTISNFNTAAIAAPVTGVVFTDSTDVVSTDTLLAAIGKLQAQLNTVVSPTTNLINTTTFNNLSNTTLANVTSLQHSVVSGKTYRFVYYLTYRSAATTTGIALTVGNFTTAGGLVSGLIRMQTGNDGTGSTYTGNLTSLGDIIQSTGVQTANTNFMARVEFNFICTTSGVIGPQFRSETNGTNVVIDAGSNATILEF